MKLQYFDHLIFFIVCYYICHLLLIDESIGIQPSTNDKSTIIDSTGSVNTITLIQQPNGQVRKLKNQKYLIPENS